MIGELGGWGAKKVRHRTLDRYYAEGRDDALTGRRPNPGTFCEGPQAPYLRMAYDAGFAAHRPRGASS